MSVLKNAFELHDVAVAGEVVHDLDLAADVFDVVAVDEFAGGDGLASELLFGLLVRHQISDAELTASQLTPKGVQ